MTITNAQRHKINRRPIRDPHIVLVEITDDVSGTVHRAAANNEDIVSNGETFIRSDIRVALPRSGDDDTEATISLSNITRIPGRAVEASQGRITCRLMLVAASDPDTIVKVDTKNLLVFRETSVSLTKVSSSLKPRAELSEPYPPKPATKEWFPGAYFT